MVNISSGVSMPVYSDEQPTPLGRSYGGCTVIRTVPIVVQVGWCSWPVRGESIHLMMMTRKLFTLIIMRCDRLLYISCMYNICVTSLACASTFGGQGEEEEELAFDRTLVKR